MTALPYHFCRAIILVGSLAIPATAQAELPQSVRAMIDAAIAEGDAKEVATIIEFARKTNPSDSGQIDAIETEYAAAQKLARAEREAEKRQEIRTAGFFENWSGEGEIGAFRSTGNSSDTGVTAGLELTRKGIDWRHKVRALVDYQRSDGVTTREQYLLSYEPNYQLTDRVYLYALGQYERDRFQGFSQRISISGGVGYRVFDTDDLQLSVKAGPAYRTTSFNDGDKANDLAALAALAFDWQITENISFTQDADAYLQSGNSTLTSTTGLEAGLGSGLSARIAYAVEYDTDPPIGAVSTDTLTRFTLVYGF